MRVIHVDEQMGWRGGEQQASYLVQGLARMGAAQALAGRPGSEFLTRDHGGAEAARFALPMRGELDLVSGVRLGLHARRFHADILHAHTSHAHTLCLVARAVAPVTRVVVSRRVDYPPKDHPLNRWKYRSADHIVAISECIRGIMADFGVPPSRLSLVHSGIDPIRMQAPPLERRALGLPDAGPLVGAVGALVGHKDHATLLRAFAEVRKSRPDARLVIAGDGPLAEPLHALADELALGGAVHWLGHRNDVPRIVRTLDLFVMSSKEEGLGTSVLDAMAAGVPVAATDAGGIPESVRHGETGLLAPRQNPEALAAIILEVLAEPAAAAARARNASAFVADAFTAGAMAAGNAAVYRKILGVESNSG